MVAGIETITLKEMLDSMDAGNVFSIGFRTYNFKKDEGGEWIEYSNCVKHNHQLKKQSSSNNSTNSTTSSKRNPNHYENSTRNIKRIDNGNLVKVHIRLIRKFNNKIVI